jgi:hypothetical protein
MAAMQEMMQQYQSGSGAQMQLGPVSGAVAPATGGVAPSTGSVAPQAQTAAPPQNNTPIPPQVIAALAARHAAQAHNVPAGLVNHVASSHAGGR